MTSKKIAIVTLNYNKNELTISCIDSLAKLNRKGIELTTIVVDNASTVPFALREDQKDDSIVIIRNDKNLGFTGGCNTGFKYALDHNFDYVLLLNNDTLVDPELVQALLKAAVENPKAGILGAKIYFAPGYEFHKDRYKKEEKGKVFWYAGGLVDWANVYTSHRGVDEVDHGQYDKIEPTEFISGCCMFMPIEVIKKVGMFDERFFLYCEDSDLNQRVKKAGYQLLYTPTAKLWHIAGGSAGGIGSNLQDYFLTRNRLLFGMKHASLRAKFALIRESFRFLLSGRTWQKRGVRDFYLLNFSKGSYPIK